MLNGGSRVITPPAADPERARLLEELSALQEEAGLLQAGLGETGSETRELEGADANNSYARNEFSGATERARARQQELEAEKKKREEFINGQIKALGDRLNVSEEKLRAVWDLAYFFQWKFKEDLESAVRQAAVEVIAEEENKRQEIFRALVAVFIKFSDAMLGTRVASGSGIPESKIYLRLPEPIPNQAIEQRANAIAQQRELEADARQLERIKADKFNDEQVAEAREDSNEAEKERAEREAEYNDAKARQERVADAYAQHRARFYEVQRQMRDISEQIELLREKS